MGTLSDTFGNKSAGQLIKSNDWNGLIQGIEAMRDDLASQIADVKTTLTARLDGLDTQAAQLRADVDALKNEVMGIENLVRLTFSAPRTLFILGELAELTVQVTDLKGAAVTNRPWVDFVTPWGFLRAAPGFTTVGGEGNRSLSVQTDETGTARALLRAENAEHLTTQTEDDFAATLTTKLPNTTTMLSEAIVAAQTPMEAKTGGVFPTLTAEYDRTDATSARSFVDTYYLKNAAMGVSRIGQAALPGWRDFQSIWSDYHTVVMAFVRPDAGQSAGIGAAALAVAFRDWIYHWINLDYLPTVQNRIPDIAARLTPKITDDYVVSVGAVRDEVNSIVNDKGVLGKFRDYEAVHQVLDTMNPPNAPAFLNSMTTSLKNAVRVQQTLETVQISAGNATGQSVAFEAFSDTASKAQPLNVNISAIQDRIGVVEKQASSLSDQIKTQDTNLATLGTKLDSTISEGGALQSLQNRLNTVSQQVTAFQGFNPTDAQQRLLQVDNLVTRVSKLEVVK